MNSTPPARRKEDTHRTPHTTQHTSTQHNTHITPHPTTYTPHHTPQHTSHTTHHTLHITRHTNVSHRGGNLSPPEASLQRMLDGMLRFRCSGDVPQRDAASPPPGTGHGGKSKLGGGFPFANARRHALASSSHGTSQSSSKPRNRYRTHLPDLPRPPPNLGIATYDLQTQDSQYSLDIHNTTQHDYPTRHSTTT